MRRRIYKIIEIGSPDDKLSVLYDHFMILCIFCSVIPLCFKETTPNVCCQYIANAFNNSIA